jgi:hypothetical protein
MTERRRKIGVSLDKSSLEHLRHGDYVKIRPSLLITVLAAALGNAVAANTVMPCGPMDRETSVHNATEAITAAKRAWAAVYSKAGWHSNFGQATVARFEPYSAVLRDGIWFVSGVVKDGKRGPVAYICASDGAASVHGT